MDVFSTTASSSASAVYVFVGGNWKIISSKEAAIQLIVQQPFFKPNVDSLKG